MCALLDTVRFGASGRVPAAEAERPLSASQGTLAGTRGQRERRAVSGHWPDRNGTATLDAQEKFLATRGSSDCPEAVIRARLLDMPTLVHLSSLSSPFASFRSAVSKPSVNQP